MGIEIRIRVMRLLSLIFFIYWPVSFVFAQNTGVSVSKSSKSEFSPRLRLWNDSFISTDYEATSAKNFGFLGASLVTHADYQGLKMDIDAAFAFNAPLLSYLNLKDIYFDKVLGDENSPYATRLQVGRKRSDWSQTDQRWDLGVWEPVFKWNPLNPERQGLTGIFLIIPFENVEIEMLGSSIYLPNQGPSFQVSETGEFKQGNPWFMPPAKSVQIWSRTSQVEYNLVKPNETAVVVQKTYATRVRAKTDSFFLQGSYAFKPMNELPLAYDGLLDIARDRGVVEIVTSVQYHEVTGADLEWHSKWIKWGVSALRDKPFGKAEFSDELKRTRPIYTEALATSSYLDFIFSPGWVVKLQYLSIEGGELKEVGPLASADRTAITKRYAYTQAQSLEIEYRGRQGLKRPWQSSLNYTLSTKNQFDLIRWRGAIQLNKFWNIFAETLLVRAQPLTRENQNEIAQFGNHDRLLAGVSYVF